MVLYSCARQWCHDLFLVLLQPLAQSRYARPRPVPFPWSQRWTVDPKARVNCLGTKRALGLFFDANGGERDGRETECTLKAEELPVDGRMMRRQLVLLTPNKNSRPPFLPTCCHPNSRFTPFTNLIHNKCFGKPSMPQSSVKRSLRGLVAPT